MSDEFATDSNIEEFSPLKMCQVLIKEEDDSSSGVERPTPDGNSEGVPTAQTNVRAQDKYESSRETAKRAILHWHHSVAVPLVNDIKSENSLPDSEVGRKLVKTGLDSVSRTQGSYVQQDLSTSLPRSHFEFLDDEESLYINISRDLPPSSSQSDKDLTTLGFPPARRRYQCPSCDRSFKKGHDLKRHILVHTGEKPFECSHCQRKFNLKGDMKRHEFSHLEAKPFSCDSCGKSFKRKDYLKTHIEIHTAQKQFACPSCSKRFKHKSSVKKHKCKSPSGRTS